MTIKEYTSHKGTFLKKIQNLSLEWKCVGSKSENIVYYPNKKDNFVSKSIDVMYFIKQDDSGNIVARNIKIIAPKEVFKKYIEDSRLVVESIKWLNR